MKKACCSILFIGLTAIVLVGRCATGPPYNPPSQTPESNTPQIMTTNDYNVVQATKGMEEK